MADPTETDPDKYVVVFEKDGVRVLEYRDEPGRTDEPPRSRESVMVTLTGFDRRVSHGAQSRDVTLRAGEVRWLDAQTNAGENIGNTASHAFFIELKGELAASEVRLPLAGRTGLDEQRIWEWGSSSGSRQGCTSRPSVRTRSAAAC